MNKQTIGYWTSTGFLTLALTFSGLGALSKQQFLIDAMTNLGFPLYVMKILGSSYILATIAIIIPKQPRIKEWAYAGVFFAMSGAIASHALAGDAFSEHVPSILIMSLAIASYILRPRDRRIALPVQVGK